jgi:endonuclease/exonuclease/phosphatase (EEP) superfamily protein YafD
VKWLTRGLALLVVLVLLAAFAFTKGSDVQVECEPHVTMAPTFTGIEKAEQAGSWLTDVGTHLASGGWGPLELLRAVKGTLDTLELWWAALHGQLPGRTPDPLVQRWKVQQQDAKRAAIATCCPNQAQPGNPDQGTTPPETPWDPKQASISTRGATSFAADTVRIAAAAARVANERHLPRRALVLVLMAGMVESSGIHNLNYGDRDSVGWLQQRAGWGTVAERMDPATAAGKFYDHLLQVRNWQNRPAGDVVQAVQISGYPGRYAAWQDEAEQLAQQVGGTADLTAGSTQDAAASCSGTPDANVVTWNVFVHNGRSDVVGGVKAIAAAGADVIGLQELSNSSTRRAVRLALPDFTMAGADSATPILLRTAKYPTVSTDHTQVAVPRHQPFEGPVQGARYVVDVTATDTAGQTVSYVNTHMLPRVQVNGHLNSSWPKRIGWYRHQLQIVTSLGASLRAKGPVILMGDMNYDGDPDGAFGAAGFTASSSVLGTTATRGRRDIDHVWAAGATPAAERLLPHYGSDHAPKWVTFASPTAGQVAAAAGAASSPAAFNLPGNRTVDQAMLYLAGWQGRSLPRGTGACLHYMGAAYGHESTEPVGGHFYAVGQWDAMPAQYKHPGRSDPPRGALVFWKTGNPAGHIAISAGGGQVWTTDPPGHPATIGLVPISQIDSWGPRIGWSAPFFVGRTKGLAA